ncbi:nucleoside-diphosphate-sugar epimerase [Novosphingobium sp. PhB165]|uniref:NAD-dependent epimerase/dehydratase family protein n=1 Tax=Novosphingobium sp. PhB165 TaxID=2485105 RepID=UPI001052510C|nr:NAD(P)-dependent oxidoreductase [Novosphingobium sp. PhB165]TCM21396.1 nucleoside-diphosphate-sugar epimerase [Novosphingobium sp. PhB165]
MLHLITGGSGFIGTRLAARLRAKGERVRVLDVVDDPARPADIEFLPGSVTDPAMVEAAMAGVDVVHHNAALVAQAAAGRAYYDVNEHGTRIVADAAVCAGVRMVMHLSTTAVYGLPPDGPITAATVPRPIEDYGRSKLAGERAMQAACQNAGIPVVTIRPRVTLGAGRLGIFAILFDWIRASRRVYVIGDGHQRQQFIHVDDLVDFHMHALEMGRSGTWNVGTDRFGSLREDLDALIGHAGSRSRVTGLPVAPSKALLHALHTVGLSPLTAWHYRTYHRDCHFDVAPLLASGWKPRHSNLDMLRESYDGFLAQSRAQGEHGPSPHQRPLEQRALRVLRAFS